MEYLVCKPHIFRGEMGEPMPLLPGQLVNVDQKGIAKKLVEQGTIRPSGAAMSAARVAQIPFAKSFGRAFRVGVFIHTSTFYSGGRIHLYQAAWTLARMGAEVFLVTDNAPRWGEDYPALPNLSMVSGAAGAPADLDLIFTDGKGWAAQQVKAWRKHHPMIPLVCLNFETPNWIRHYAPEAAPNQPEMESCYQQASLVLCNSGESLKWLREFMPINCLTGVLPPAANTFALDQDCILPEDVDTSEPYIVWSARSSAYKGLSVITAAIQQMAQPMNLVMIGKPGAMPSDTKLHKFFKFMKPITDAQKMRLIAGAQCVAAPSRFEGYGMVPGEALCNGVPVVVYDLPVLRQNYGDRLVYAKWNDPADFAKKLAQVIESKPAVDKAEARETYGMGAMQRQVESLPFLSFKRKRVSVQMIVYYGATVQEAIAAVYPYADEILVAYGPTTLWSHYPADGTLELLRACPDPEKKIRIIEAPKGIWKDKTEMRQACQKVMTGNYLLIVDADEIYHNLDKWLAADIDYGCPRWVHFWHDIEHFVVDSAGMERWGKPHPLGGGTHNHFRWAYWRYSNYWYSTRGTVAMDANGQRLTSQAEMLKAVKICPECCIYHLGHVLQPALMKAKHDYYIERDGADKGRLERARAWHEWSGKTGFCGDGNVQRVSWELPALVKQAFARIQK